MKDVRQSPKYAQFMLDLGWKAEKIDDISVYLRKFPIIGYFAKIPRPAPPFNFPVIKQFMNDHHVFRLKIAPFVDAKNKNCPQYQKEFADNGFITENSPFNPTTTIYIDLTQKEELIFSNFVDAKRRGVRRAIKNGITVRMSEDLESFIKIRKKQFAPLGFLVTSEMRFLWKNFYPKNASLLLANSPKYHYPVAGILLLFYDGISYYWYASALGIGKKLFAPTLLVWEALKLAKKRGCQIFDFEGIYDDRFPKAAASWKGFSKFKEGFCGEKIVFLENFKK